MLCQCATAKVGDYVTVKVGDYVTANVRDYVMPVCYCESKGLCNMPVCYCSIVGLCYANVLLQKWGIMLLRK